MIEIYICLVRLDEFVMLISFEQGIVVVEWLFDFMFKVGEIYYYDIGVLIESLEVEVVVVVVGDEFVGLGYI